MRGCQGVRQLRGLSLTDLRYPHTYQSPFGMEVRPRSKQYRVGFLWFSLSSIGWVWQQNRGTLP